MINIFIINLVLPVLIFIYMISRPSYFGPIMNFIVFCQFLFIYHLIASAILVFIRLVIVKNGLERLIPRAVIGIVSICAMILSIINTHNWAPFFRYPFKIHTLIYIWAKNVPMKVLGNHSLLLTIVFSVIFSIVSWKEFRSELKHKKSKT